MQAVHGGFCQGRCGSFPSFWPPEGFPVEETRECALLSMVLARAFPKGALNRRGLKGVREYQCK